MSDENPTHALASAFTECHAELIAHWREQVRALPSARDLDQLELTDHIPDLVAEITRDLAPPRADAGADEEGISPRHGVQRFHDGFDLREVVAEYHVLREAFRTIAERRGLIVAGDAARTINRRIDEAIGLAVEAFAERQAIERKKQQAEHLAFFAHDLRTPLNAIGLVIAEIEQSLDEKNRAQVGEWFDMARRSLQRLEVLVKNEMETNLQPAGDDGVFHPVRRQFELWPLVQRLIQELKPLAMKEGIEFGNAVPHALTVHADAGLLAEVFQNLLGNACKYAARGQIEISAREENGIVTCAVRDNGAGIPPEMLPRVFDKLETDPGKDGTGLGLAIVKQIIEAHGGAVSVASMLGAGALFTFTLPPAAPR